jgi:hypothetical protein
MMLGHEIIAACWLTYDGISVGDEAREVEGGVADQGERVQAVALGKLGFAVIIAKWSAPVQHYPRIQKWVPAAKAGKRAYDEGRLAPAPRR